MIYNIYKPIGWTSFDVVKKLRGITRDKKVGHGGTLDPFAEGVLVIGTNADTKVLTEISGTIKSYRATLTLGEETDTLDIDGKIIICDMGFHLERYIEVTEDKALISLTFEDGSMGSIHYFANGGKSFPKERIEVFCDNAVLQLDNFRKLRGFGWKGFNKMNLWSQDKGQENCVDAFMDSVREGRENPISQDEIFEVARVSVDIAEMLRK